MSQTESLGVADAARWIGVAASMEDYLQSWLTANRKTPPVPRGIFAGARRFLNYALEGIYLDRRERSQPQIPIMAGISNMTIALGVFRRLTNQPEALDKIERDLKDFLECLQAIEAAEDRSETLQSRVGALQQFFRELRQQGDRELHAS